MSRLDILAETVKLARLLGTSPEALHYLQPLAATELKTLRERVSAEQFESTRPMFQRVALASKLLPNALVALVGEKIFGDVLCARIAGLLPPDRAADIANSMPDAFLADVAVALDPASAREVIARIPPKRVVAVGLILVQRGDFITMGRFVSYLAPATIKLAMEAIKSDEALLRTAFFIESKDKLNELIGLLPESRLRSSILLAADDRVGLWTEALALMDHANDHWRRRIGDIAAGEDAHVLTGMLQAAQRLQVWDSVLPIVSAMSEPSQRKVAALPGLADEAVLKSIITAAQDNELWSDLLPLVGHMHEDARRIAARVVEHLSRDVLVTVLKVASRERLWPDLIAILRLMDDAEKRDVVRLIGEQDEALLTELFHAVDRAALWDDLLPLLEYVGPRIGDLKTLGRKLGVWDRFVQKYPQLDRL